MEVGSLSSWVSVDVIFGGKAGREESRMVLAVRSVARRRALAVARRDGRGRGGLREVMSVVRNVLEGDGRDAEIMALRS